MILLGSHVSMGGKEQFLGSVKEALSYNANTFMVYTGAPQNSKRKPLEELLIPQAKELMKKSGINRFIVHAPYIINLANTQKPETFELGKEILKSELERACAMGSEILVLHPGSAVGAEASLGIAKVIEGLDWVLANTEKGLITLETMAGKGSEIGRTIDELKDVFDGVKDNSRLRICIDTCHLNDAGYDVSGNFDGILDEIESKIGVGRIAAVHVNDSMNPLGAHKDRHANIGAGTIGLEALRKVVHNQRLDGIPMCLETPHIKSEANPKDTHAPYKEEIAMLR